MGNVIKLRRNDENMVGKENRKCRVEDKRGIEMLVKEQIQGKCLETKKRVGNEMKGERMRKE